MNLSLAMLRQGKSYTSLSLTMLRHGESCTCGDGVSWIEHETEQFEMCQGPLGFTTDKLFRR